MDLPNSPPRMHQAVDRPTCCHTSPLSWEKLSWVPLPLWWLFCDCFSDHPSWTLSPAPSCSHLQGALSPLSPAYFYGQLRTSAWLPRYPLGSTWRHPGPSPHLLPAAAHPVTVSHQPQPPLHQGLHPPHSTEPRADPKGPRCSNVPPVTLLPPTVPPGQLSPLHAHRQPPSGWPQSSVLATGTPLCSAGLHLQGSSL